MDLSLNELLLKRLKYTEFQGNYSPTMDLIPKNNINPKFFKLKKFFSKAPQLHFSYRKPINLFTKILPKPYFKPKMNTEQLLSPSKEILSIFSAKFEKPEKFPQIFSKISLETKVSSEKKYNKTKKLPKLVINASKISINNKFSNKTEDYKISEFEKLAQNYEYQTRTLNEPGLRECQISHSLDLSHSNRKIIFSKKKNPKNFKDFASFYDSNMKNFSSDSSASNF